MTRSGDRISDASLLRMNWFGACCGAFLLIFGVKAIIASIYGSAVPHMDQWDVEAANLYRPYISGTLSWSDIVASHNEHRVAMTRLFDLALFELAGGWDPYLLMFGNGALHAGFVVYLVNLIAPAAPVPYRLSVLILCALTFAAPLGWDNVVIGGDRSVPYFLLLFAAIAIAGIVTHDAFSSRWWIGLAATVLAYFSMASGTFAVLAALAVTLMQLALGVRRRSAREWLGAAVLVLAGIVMVLLIQRIAGHENLKATGIGQFLLALALIGALPFANAGGVVIVQLPLLALVHRTLRTPPVLQNSLWVVLGLAAFVAALGLSLAYARAGWVRSSHYIDMLLVLMPLNYVALLALTAEVSEPSHRRRWIPLLVSSWLLIMLVVLAVRCVQFAAPALSSRAVDAKMQEQTVRDYLATGDLAALRSVPARALPYPVPDRLASLLSDPAIRALLPAPIRPADADADAMRARTILKGGMMSATAMIREFMRSNAWLIAGFGLALLLACAQARIMMTSRIRV